MERVTGIGGIFFKSSDPRALAAFYRDHLGMDPSFEHGVVFRWREEGGQGGSTVWSPFAADTRYFEPSRAPFMINLRVRDLDKMLTQLRAAGVAVDEKIEASEFGRFGWFMDPDGNRVELWQPPEGM
jgi:catechol 2,3-dioxygenase-like lactoylglutathione lyase family enzyme